MLELLLPRQSTIPRNLRMLRQLFALTVALMGLINGLTILLPARPGRLALLTILVNLLAPFAPYLAHELWEMLGEKTSLLRALWPKYDPVLAKEEEIEIPVQVNGKLRGRILILADATEDVLRERALADDKVRAAIAGRQVVKVIVVPSKLVNIVIR